MRPLLYALLCAWLLWAQPMLCSDNGLCVKSAVKPWRLIDAYETRKECQASIAAQGKTYTTRCLPQGTYPEL